MRWPLFISAVFVSSVLSWGCRKDPPAEPEPEALPVDSGFVPARDGFGFENFAGYVRTAVFSPDAAYRMYGEPACSRVTDAGQCVLAPAMAQWSAQVNASTRGGLCEGFAVASWLGYTGQIDLSKFGDVGDGVSSLDRAAMSEIDFEIAYWFATQSLPGVIDATEGVGGARRGAHLRGTPRVNSRRLSRRDRQDGREREPRRGHAVTPYKVEVDGDKVSVYVYDSNHPSDNSRVLEIDRAADTWRYVASQNPDEPEGIYEGDTTNNNKIWLVSDKPRIGIQECDFCEGSASDTRTTNTFGGDRCDRHGRLGRGARTHRQRVLLRELRWRGEAVFLDVLARQGAARLPYALEPGAQDHGEALARSICSGHVLDRELRARR